MLSPSSTRYLADDGGLDNYRGLQEFQAPGLRVATNVKMSEEGPTSGGIVWIQSRRGDSRKCFCSALFFLAASNKTRLSRMPYAFSVGEKQEPRNEWMHVMSNRLIPIIVPHPGDDDIRRVSRAAARRQIKRAAERSQACQTSRQSASTNESVPSSSVI